MSRPILNPDRVLGEFLREVREDFGMSQDRLSSLMGWSSNSVVSKVESGERRLGLVEFTSYATALNWEPDELLKEFTDRLLEREEDERKWSAIAPPAENRK